MCALSQELFPANKRSCEHFSKYFTDAGLKELSDFARNQQSIGARKELQKELQEQISRGEPLKDVSLVTPFTFLCESHGSLSYCRVQFGCEDVGGEGGVPNVAAKV